MTTQRKTVEILGGDDDWRDTVGGPPEKLPAVQQEPPPPTEEESFVDRIRSIASRQGIDRTKVKLYRRGNGTELEFCRDYSADEFDQGDLTLIRDEWGPGQYQIRVVGPKGVAMREQVSIAKPASAPVQHNGELSEVIRMLAQGQQAILEAVSQRPDPMANMQQTLSMMVTMREAMGLNAAPAAQSSSAMLGEIVGAIRQLREVADEVSPKAAPDVSDNPMAMLPTVLDLVKTAMVQQQPAVQQIAIPQSITAPIQQNPVDSVIENTQNQTENTATEEEEEPMNIFIVKTVFTKLLNAAVKNAPIEKAVELLDYLPEEMIEHIENEKWFDLLLTVAPQAEAHREYLTKVRDQWVKEINAPEEGDEPAAP